MSTYQSNQILATKTYKVIGKRPIRHDGFDKVTGRARFSADIQMPGLCFGKILRSPHAHAKIRSIDTSKAEALPGVVAVVSSLDLPEVSANIADLEEGAIVNYGFYSRNVLAREKSLYIGHAVAAVAATSLAKAEEALSLIDVEYEVLPPVLNAEQAMQSAHGRGTLVLRTWHNIEDEIVVLEVNDDGPGVPEDVRLKIFDPFFT